MKTENIKRKRTHSIIIYYIITKVKLLTDIGKY